MLDAGLIDPKTLRNAFGRFATGVTVVTMRDEEGRGTGVTVNSFSSLSLDPPLLLFSLGNAQVSRRWLKDGRHFVVNVLSADQEAIAWQFAKPRDDKFEGVDAAPGARCDVPCIEGAIARFECRHHASYPGGDHEIIVGEVLHLETAPGEPMLFFGGAMARLAV
jgi:flavin reductase (DIM6/NTAB) family NADH-FMN oxidoreductase RutF